MTLTFLALAACLPELTIPLDSKPIVTDDSGETGIDDSGDDTGCEPSDEVCNDLDDDCDGEVDEDAADATTWYVDADGDGHGSDAATEAACAQPTGYVAIADDCNDENAEINPDALETDCTDPTDYNCDGSGDATDADLDGYPACEDCDDGDFHRSPAESETCNDVDDDCDGSVDEDATDPSTWYEDVDGDGFGNDLVTDSACDQPSGYVSASGDCNDAEASVNPSASESCNGVDDDCDGTVPADEEDADRDGYATCAGDCDDTESEVSPGATEECDGVTDEDCDGLVDEDLDDDGDGETTCEGDCDDSDATVGTGASESCNGVDDDCDGTVDDGLSATIYYRDYDGDSYGDSSDMLAACDTPVGYVENDEDCDDYDATVSPSGSESANGTDDDCDGTVDEGTSLYDDDGDGSSEAVGDCDDTDPAISPSATESCDSVDEDCDGTIDESTDCYDDDGDGYTEDAGDCNDAASGIYPGATENCDGYDEDCDGSTDEGAGTPYYLDSDRDGYGDSSSSTTTCTAPSGYVSVGGDCDDDAAAANPGITAEDGYGSGHECYDLVDNDCDGNTDWVDSVECPTGMAYTATGSSLLADGSMDSGPTVDWYDMATGGSSDDSTTVLSYAGSSSYIYSTGVGGSDYYMEIVQSSTSSNYYNEAVCTDLVGLTVGDYYLVSLVYRTQSSASVQFGVCWIETSSIGSTVDLTPSASIGECDGTYSATSSWGEFTKLFRATEADTTLCLGVDEGSDLLFDQISVWATY